MGPIDWLVYKHQNIYRGQGASAVLDDYPGNVNTSRRLFRVPTLELGGVPRHALARNGLLVAYWTPAGVRTEGDLELLSRPMLSGQSRKSEPPVSPEHPIAIGCASGASMQTGPIGPLRVQRPIHYRIVPGLPQAAQVGQVPDACLYVLGDNVPLSSDSRQNGPIHYGAVVGVVEQWDSVATDVMAEVIQPPPITRVPS